MGKIGENSRFYAIISINIHVLYVDDKWAMRLIFVLVKFRHDFDPFNTLSTQGRLKDS
jgi:hypothetical protein